YRDYPPTAPEAGAPVLCLHGLTRNERDFEDVAPRIAALGRRVIAASMRGRAGSDPDPDHARYLPVTYVGDMALLLEELGLERVIVVGTSMGGLMAMVMAATAPQSLVAVALNDIGPELAPEGLARIQGYVGGGAPVTSWAEAAAATRAINGVAFPDETGEEFWLAFARRIFREEAPDRIVLDYDPAISKPVQAGDAAPPDLWPLFEALKPIPTLLVRGALTDLLAPETVAAMKERKPDLEVAEVPRVGHAPLLTEPVAWEALERFIRNAPG
ncbi:MAG: alpha/beta hydrolase, partial [Caulobacterales bacterium]|nr:alpha/beta hydrolase [Caulobacterales bacterium]